MKGSAGKRQECEKQMTRNTHEYIFRNSNKAGEAEKAKQASLKLEGMRSGSADVCGVMMMLLLGSAIHYFRTSKDH